MAFRTWQAAICSLVGAVLLAVPGAAGNTESPPLRIAQIRSHPGGLTYGGWAARWWQWVLETPASVSPIVDETGRDCGERQLGAVWFLAGTIGSGTVRRACSVPGDAALFFPLANQFYGAFLTDPPGQRTEQFIKSQVDCGEPAELLVLELDGRMLDGLDQLFVESTLFDVGLPEDNLFGADESTVPELRLSPSVSAWLLCLPVSPAGGPPQAALAGLLVPRRADRHLRADDRRRPQAEAVRPAAPGRSQSLTALRSVANLQKAGL